jgi:hypothetical protein
MGTEQCKASLTCLSNQNTNTTQPDICSIFYFSTQLYSSFALFGSMLHLSKERLPMMDQSYHADRCIDYGVPVATVAAGTTTTTTTTTKEESTTGPPKAITSKVLHQHRTIGLRATDIYEDDISWQNGVGHAYIGVFWMAWGAGLGGVPLTFFVATLWELGWKVWTWWRAGTLLLNLIVLPLPILIGNSYFAFGFTTVMYVCGSLLMQASLGSGHWVVLNSAGLMSLGAFYWWLHWFVVVSMGIEFNGWQWLYFYFPFYLCGYSLCALSILNLLGYFVRLCLKTTRHGGSKILPL